MQGPLNIAIIGAGTAGAAAAIFLAQKGHLVTLFEKVAEPAPIGAGIVLQPTGLRILDALGIASDVVERGAIINRLHASTWSGKSVVDLAYRLIDARYFGLGIHRGALFDALIAGVKAHHVPLICGVNIEGVVETPDGARCQATTGEEHGPYDAVVVGAGAGTELREALGVKHRTRRYPWGAMWSVIEDTAGVFTETRTLTQYVRGAQSMLGFLPTGLGPHGDVPLVSLYWSIRNDRVADWRAKGLQRWREDILSADKRAGPLLDQIHSLDEIIHGPYYHVVMKRPHVGRVIFLGDAAHAMSPQLGQGANLALSDAWEFARSVAETSTVSEAFATYTKRRRRHLGYYQWATRFLTPFFQSDSRLLGWLRDTFMGPMGRIGPFGRLMTSTMCGVRRGLFRRSLTPPPLALPAPRDASTPT